jgi:hypothetical protein
VIIMTLADNAEILFVSYLQPSDHPSYEQVAAAIQLTIRAQGGLSGCAEAVAAEYGEHPETSAGRMRWALGLLADRTASLAVAA